MNKSDFDNIVITKKKNRDAIEELKIDISVFLYAALIKRKPLKEIFSGLRGILNESKAPQTRAMRDRVGTLAKKTYKLSQMPAPDRSDIVLRIIDDDSFFKSFDRAANKALNKIETNMKDEIFEKDLKEPDHIEDISNEKCFVLASRHDDCAEDHKPYQGKIYVKEYALKYKAVKEYCFEHDIQTVEWVTGKPAWLTTRPNCRHFFKDMSMRDILGTKTDVLLKEYGMDRVAGTRGAWQTVKHKTTKEWYTEQNVRGIIKKYKDRLKKHKRMAEVFENENLSNEIGKDKLLIDKWETYLQSMIERGK